MPKGMAVSVFGVLARSVRLAKAIRCGPYAALMIRGVISVLALVFGSAASAGEATVAVAANFLETAEEIAALFEYETGDSIVLAHGSTGRLYAQIVNGAPFDIFLAADAVRPAALEEAGLTYDSTTYAIGRLVLVGREPFRLGKDLNKGR